MSWTGPDDLKAQLLRLWNRGELLRPLVSGESSFPLRLRLKGPDSSALSERFEAVRSWAAELSAMRNIRVEWRELRHRVQGAQTLPHNVWIDTLDEAWLLVGKRREAERFIQILAQTRAQLPSLLPWLARYPLRAVEAFEFWPHLLAVTRWLLEHPRPGIYLRQVDIPGAHSKFIEAHRGTLRELFDLALAPESIRQELTDIGQFAARYGFLDKPLRLRFRALDSRLQLLPGTSMADISLDAENFASLRIPVKRVFITENETNFLALPAVDGAIAIFGAGYGWDALSRAAWLDDCVIHYWGDIDTHGFAILDQLRAHFAHVQSFLMDRATLLAHEAQWGREDDQVRHALPRLTAEEQALFADLRDNRIRQNLRLEQERVGYNRIKNVLSDLAPDLL
jgi:hypothetical protein